MRRLDILLIGQSQALTDLSLELEQHGHSLMRFDTLNEQPSFDLLIDDASVPFADFSETPRLTLQLGVGGTEAGGLPSLDVLCTYNSALFTRVPIADVLNRQAGVVDQQVSVTQRLLVDGCQAHQRMTVLFKFQRQVGQGLALSNEQNVETSHDGLLVKPGNR